MDGVGAPTTLDRWALAAARHQQTRRRVLAHLTHPRRACGTASCQQARGSAHSLGVCARYTSRSEHRSSRPGQQDSAYGLGFAQAGRILPDDSCLTLGIQPTVAWTKTTVMAQKARPALARTWEFQGPPFTGRLVDEVVGARISIRARGTHSSAKAGYVNATLSLCQTRRFVLANAGRTICEILVAR